MAYLHDNLTLLAGSRGRPSALRIWHYFSPEAVTTVRGANYISNALGQGMRVKDLVIVDEVHASTGALETRSLCSVLAVTSSGADLSDGTALDLTNT